MEQKEKVEKMIKNTEVNRILIEVRNYHEKQNSLFSNISKFIMTFVGGLLAFFVIQGLSPEVSDNARSAYTLFGILLIIPFVLLLFVLFDFGRVRNKSKKTELTDLYNSKQVSRFCQADFYVIVKHKLRSEKLTTENNLLCDQILLISNKIKVKKSLMWIIPIIPIIEFGFVIVSLFTLYYQ